MPQKWGSGKTISLYMASLWGVGFLKVVILLTRSLRVLRASQEHQKIHKVTLVIYYESKQS